MPQTQVSCICLECDKTFSVRLGEFNQGRRKFCSKSCTYKGRSRTRKENRLPLIDRFWASVNKTDSCWLWTLGTNNVYGVIYHDDYKKRRMFVHRLSYEIHFGVIPEGFQVCHNCPSGDNPLCVNPAHLFLGTQADNMADKVKKGRQPKGRSIPWSKLTEEDIPIIRKSVANGVPQTQLAKQYNVSTATISMVVNRKRWEYIP